MLAERTRVKRRWDKDVGARGRRREKMRAGKGRGERRKERARWMVGTSAFHDVGTARRR